MLATAGQRWITIARCKIGYNMGECFDENVIIFYLFRNYILYQQHYPTSVYLTTPGHRWPEVAIHPQPPLATPERLIYRMQKIREEYFSGFPFKKAMYSCKTKFCTIKAWKNHFVEIGCDEAGKSFTLNCCPTMTNPKSAINSSQAPRHFAGKMVKHQF